MLTRALTGLILRPVKFRALVGSIFLISAVGLTVRSNAQSSGRKPQSARALPHLSSKELKIYRKARTLIDWTPREIKRFPTLYRLHPASSQSQLPMILDRVGKVGMAMLAGFRNIVCEEHMFSEWTLGRPIATYREMGPNEVVHHFRYIIIPTSGGNPRMFKEYRTSPKGKPIKLMNLDDLILITTNFTGSWAYFSTSDQPESRFRYFGKEMIRKSECYVVGFSQIPGIARNVSTFEVGKHSAVLLEQGLAWIDVKTFHILKIETWLLAPRGDMGLENQTTTVEYFPVQPEGLKTFLWLPRKVTVNIHFYRAYIRNTHLYSKFKLFRVESAIKP